MNEFIITEKQLKKSYSDCVTDKEYFKILSRPLSEELKKERERVFDKVMGTISNLNLPCNMNPYDTVACIRGEIESLRGEP